MTVQTDPPTSDIRGLQTRDHRPQGVLTVRSGAALSSLPQIRDAASAPRPQSRKAGNRPPFPSPTQNPLPILPPNVVTSLPRDTNSAGPTLRSRRRLRPPIKLLIGRVPRGPAPRAARQRRSDALRLGASRRRLEARVARPMTLHILHCEFRETERAGGRRLWPVFWRLDGVSSEGTLGPPRGAEVRAPCRLSPSCPAPFPPPLEPVGAHARSRRGRAASVRRGEGGARGSYVASRT